MASATILGAGKDQRVAFLAVEVQEAWGRTEYRGEVPLAQLVGLTKPQIKAALGAACKAVRDSVLAEQAAAALPDIDFTGTVTV